MHRFLFAVVVFCACALAFPLSASVVITEFLAENDGGLRDADGDAPDWIELRNQGATTADLTGWHLTDNATNLTKWTFPAVSLPSGAHLIVFASGKDRAMAGAELHTNFRLENSGGYLALVAPDGTTVVQSFQYPQQRGNVSFGLGRIASTTTLLAAGANARFHVPANDALGLSWTGSGFDDSGWTVENTPLAFSSGAVPGATVLAIDINERGVDAAANTQSGFQSFVINSNLSATALQTNATTRTFGGISVTVSNTAPLGYDDRLRSTPVDGGSFTEGAVLRDFVFSRDNTGNGGLDVAITGLAANTAYEFTIWSFDSSSHGGRTANWFANGTLVKDKYRFDGRVLPTSNADYQFTFTGTTDGGGTMLISGRRDASSVNQNGGADFGVFLNALRIVSLNNTAPTNALGSAMFGNNASAYVRVPFHVADPGGVSELTLRMRYDDGFVAYLNGQPVTSRNAPSPLAWNSAATGPHSSAVAEEISFTPPAGALVAGQNVLAIHGLNLASSDGDAFFGPEIMAQNVTFFTNRYFATPTPGSNNVEGLIGLVADTKFSVNRGFYDAPFSLSITSATAGAEIRYTTNGSIPTPANGFVFNSPIQITGHSFIRAAAFLSNHVPSDVDTHSYVFLRDVLRQSNNIPGYPTVWQASYPADYGMDSNIVNHPVYGATLSNDLRSIPSLFIVSDHNGFWNQSSGIYPNATSSGPAWERETSVELIDGDGSTEFATTCKIEMHGNASRDNVRTPKHSMRLSFNSEFGPTRLRYDWFPGPGANEHDAIVLRSCGFVDGWAGRYADSGIYTSTETGETFRGLRYRPENTCYLRDVWVKESFRGMGWAASRTAYVHLYINGLYWGLYQPSERLDATFFSETLGGDEGAWDVVVGEDNNGPPVLVDGSLAGWQNVLNIVNAGITNEAAYAAVTNLVDIDNLIDYMLLHIFAESEDWPRHNWYVASRRPTNGVPGTKFVCSVWDQELTLDRLVRRNRINVGGGAGEIYSPARVYQQLRAWPEFRRQFGDRVQKHLFNGGALVSSNSVARLLAHAAIIRDAVVGESARWGDARKTGVPAGQVGTGVTFTRDEWWQPEIDKLATNFLVKLTADNVARFRAGALFPSNGAPEFNQFGGNVSNGFALVLTHTNASGTIYFTTDGSDPRAYSSAAVAASAQAYSAPVPINAPTLVRARVLDASGWSALVEAVFYPPQDLSRLALTEIMFNPPDRGVTDGDEFEFLELKNTGTNTLNLSGLTFSGINFTFPNGTLLAPGEFFVLARNAAAFASKYPGVAVNGVYSGRLDNGGETIALAHALGGNIFSVTYDDSAPWPVAADGHGFSIVQPGTTQAPDNGSRWRASTAVGGSPGADDPSPTIPAVVINEVLTHPAVNEVDAIELHNLTAAPVDVGGWFLTDERTAPKKFRIPNGTTIPAGGFVVFTETHFNATPGTNNSFSLSSLGEEVYLFSGDADTNLTGYSHGLEFGAADFSTSFGRYLNSVGEEHFPPQSSKTFGAANSGPRISDVVINEIHYHAALATEEFIELHNRRDDWVPLWDRSHPTNTWRIDGVSFQFPTNTVVPARGYVLVVATNPAAFRARYSVPTEVQVFGPYAGSLQDSGERISLQKPGALVSNTVPYITIETVRYNDRAPWPAAADGGGASLGRIVANAYADDPTNWLAGAPTPGMFNAERDSDGDGVPDSWEVATGTDPSVADAHLDPDGDGQTSLQEYFAGTNPLNPDSVLRVESVSGAVQFSFLAVSNRSYRVEFTDSLQPAAWSGLTNIAPAAQNRTVTVGDPANSSTRFYRLTAP